MGVVSKQISYEPLFLRMFLHLGNVGRLVHERSVAVKFTAPALHVHELPRGCVFSTSGRLRDAPIGEDRHTKREGVSKPHWPRIHRARTINTIPLVSIPSRDPLRRGDLPVQIYHGSMGLGLIQYGDSPRFPRRDCGRIPPAATLRAF